MSDQWEQYVEEAAAAMLDCDHNGIQCYDPQPIDATVRAVLEAVGPRIVEDTKQRLVEAAARAVERETPPAAGTTNPFASLECTLAFSSQDWGAAGDFAWLYGIVLGWDGDSPDESVMAELAAKYEWSDQRVERLRTLHRDFQAAAAAYKCQTPEGAA